MRAAVYRGREKLTVEDVDEPDCTPGSVKVRVAHNGICGTDLHEFYAGPIYVPTEPHPLTGYQLPLTLGHEFAGTVVETGEDVRNVVVGDRVTIEPVYRCGKCPSCQLGHYNICQRIGFHGLMAPGGMAEYTVVPAWMAYRLPDSISPDLGALVEPMSVAYHATRLSEVHEGNSAVIFGAGPIGIGIWFALRGIGVEAVTIVEPSPTRREAIAALGAIDVLDPARTDPAKHIAQRTRGHGADAAFDAAGVVSSISSALSCLAARRRLVAVAIYEQPVRTELLKLIMNESLIQGSLCYTSVDYRAVIDLMARGHYDTTGWVTHIPIEQVVEEGFAALRAGRKMKVLVDP
ncbi:2,3-butanediol dehydrogenase [Saccharopolyspora sp. K220]|uniref:2,3-butanediol dehydrogenase n=1 Tax=Saccharopolyspora soli TaxID=2926618 RepID=UPI001F56749D|nr:2,3-butanediol dehydrogenase [Saccharopolyspora soli]MCI2422765.1 2,3-butanediol dehydrogenase [Saccharopolyspora soli]